YSFASVEGRTPGIAANAYFKSYLSTYQGQVRIQRYGVSAGNTQVQYECRRKSRLARVPEEEVSVLKVGEGTLKVVATNVNDGRQSSVGLESEFVKVPPWIYEGSCYDAPSSKTLEAGLVTSRSLPQATSATSPAPARILSCNLNGERSVP